MSKVQRRLELERCIERREDLEAYIVSTQREGGNPEYLRVAREELAKIGELCREISEFLATGGPNLG